ncbi:helix-turn-helix domain-containing protein [Variovorax sp.]|uniref:helix-turn-helix domain-containing protein n=1 Tax=Variovorax sp. TaxID=1871043 RepID=UPI003BAB7488
MFSTLDVIDSEQCAELLRCTSDQVEELARAGEIPGLKLGRGWIFVYADLLLFLSEKAREEAHERRMKHQPHAPQPMAKPRRQTPPVLPTLPVVATHPTGPSLQEALAPPAPVRRALATADPPPFHQQRLYVSVAEAARMLSIGKSTFWREVKAGNLPAPVKLAGLSRWRIEDLQQWVAGLPKALNLASAPGAPSRQADSAPEPSLMPPHSAASDKDQVIEEYSHAGMTIQICRDAGLSKRPTYYAVVINPATKTRSGSPVDGSSYAELRAAAAVRAERKAFLWQKRTQRSK